jgi:type IV pilus assembly PilO-like protein
LQASIEKARADVQSRRLKIDRLEKLSAQLETLAQDRQQLYTSHFIPKETGWSAILSKLDSMVQASVVKNVRKDYASADAAQYGLLSVKIRLPVMGLYPSIMRFINEIETADTFFIINSIDVRASESPGMPEVLMNLNIETFFYQ